MLLKRLLTLILASLIVVVGTALPAQAQCNKCYKLQVPIPGVNGVVSSSDGRRIVNVRIDQSWGTPTTNANIWNGINGCTGCTGPNALQLWNDVLSPYYFRLAQDPTQANHATDIVIRKGNPSNASIFAPVSTNDCAATVWANVAGSVREITLPPESVNWSAETIACIVAHEIGHGIGLVDVYNNACVSIMNQEKAGKGCTECQTKTVQQKDVDRANQQAADPTNNCTVGDTSGNIVPVPTPTPTIGNTGGGGCQSYFDTMLVYDDTGGSNCSYTYAVFTTYCNGQLDYFSIDLMYAENCAYVR